MLNLEYTFEQLALVEDASERQLLAKALMSTRKHAALTGDSVSWLVIQAIPVLKFPADWEVKIVPSVNAAVRFLAKGYSVYLDMVCELGHYRCPYWEVWDGGDEPQRFPMLATSELLNYIGK